jgi:uncharacterized delta-60 repeat protein
VVVQADGKILVCGSASVERRFSSMAVARFNPDGSPDRKFRPRGVLLLRAPARIGVLGADVDALPDGGFVLTGMTQIGPYRLLAVGRFRADFRPDTAFGRRGQSGRFSDGTGTFSELLVQPDGKYVVAKYVPQAGVPDSKLLLTRFTLVETARRRRARI